MGHSAVCATFAFGRASWRFKGEGTLGAGDIGWAGSTIGNGFMGRRGFWSGRRGLRTGKVVLPSSAGAFFMVCLCLCLCLPASSAERTPVVLR